MSEIENIDLLRHDRGRGGAAQAGRGEDYLVGRLGGRQVEVRADSHSRPEHWSTAVAQPVPLDSFPDPLLAMKADDIR